MSLSVKSIASCGCGKTGQLLFAVEKRYFFFRGGGLLTPATPKFSMAGILWPDVMFSEGRDWFNTAHRSKSVVSVLWGNAPRKSNSRSFSGLR